MDLEPLAHMWQSMGEKPRRQFMAGLMGMMSVHVSKEAEPYVLVAARELADQLREETR